MRRVAPTALVVVLLAATATAFTVTERLKLQPSPILGPRVDKLFAPACRCDSARAAITFRLRRADRLELVIIDLDGRVVRTLVQGRRYGRGPVAVAWDGRDDAGALVPEGSYQPRVHLAEQHRTIVMPNEIRVDLTPPKVLSAAAAPRVISPDGDRRRDRVVVSYRLSEDARALLYVGGNQRVKTLFARAEGRLEWYGRHAGRAYEGGQYALSVAASDPAGNVGERLSAGSLTVRYVALDPSRIDVVAGRRLAVSVDTDAASYRWRFAGGSRTSSERRLLLRAPRRPGAYTLFVEANGRAASARVIVRRGS